MILRVQSKKSGLENIQSENKGVESRGYSLKSLKLKVYGFRKSQIFEFLSIFGIFFTVFSKTIQPNLR